MSESAPSKLHKKHKTRGEGSEKSNKSNSKKSHKSDSKKSKHSDKSKKSDKSKDSKKDKDSKSKDSKKSKKDKDSKSKDSKKPKKDKDSKKSDKSKDSKKSSKKAKGSEESSKKIKKEKKDKTKTKDKSKSKDKENDKKTGAIKELTVDEIKQQTKGFIIVPKDQYENLKSGDQIRYLGIDGGFRKGGYILHKGKAGTNSWAIGFTKSSYGKMNVNDYNNHYYYLNWASIQTLWKSIDFETTLILKAMDDKQAYINDLTLFLYQKFGSEFRDFMNYQEQKRKVNE